MAPKAEKKHVASVSFTSLALHLSMLIVGAQYNGGGGEFVKKNNVKRQQGYANLILFQIHNFGN